MTEDVEQSLWRCGRCGKVWRHRTRRVRLSEWVGDEEVVTTIALCRTCYSAVRNGERPYSTDQDTAPEGTP
jgi:hypothetical protein